MIGGVVRHGRSRRDAANLAAHVLKGDERPEVEILNSVAQDLPALMRDMQVARDGSRADAAFLHIHISPETSMSKDQLRRAAEIVREHLGAADHACGLVFHGKPRKGGVGDRHVHLVLSRIGPDGQVIPSGFEKIRLETAMRMAEFELGEKATLGRHHASAVKWLLKNGRQDVAAWLEAAHGSDPVQPRSAASPAKRQALKRQGVDLPEVREIVKAAWASSDDAKSFRAAMREQGFEITPGRKDGVWLVTKGGVEIGALDRIIREKRAVVAARMKEIRHVAAAPEARPEVESRGGVDLARSARRPHDEREAAAPAGAPSGRRGRGRTPGRSEGPAGADPALAEASPSEPRRPAREGRRPRPAAEAVAVRQLALVGRDERLKALAADLAEIAQPKPRRSRWAAEAVTVHGLAKVARAESLQVAREELRRAMQPALQRVSAYLDGREAKAREALEASRQPVPEPAVILQVRKQLDEARQDSQAAFYGTLEPERQAKEILEREKPKGFLAWITGRTAAWRRDRDAAEAELARIRALRAERRDAVERLEGQLRSLERAFRGQMDSERRQREREGRRARDELALIAAARACLRENPDLARQGEREVLRAARERLQREQEERIRRAQAARWQASIIEDRPAAPRVS